MQGKRNFVIMKGLNSSIVINAEQAYVATDGSLILSNGGGADIITALASGQWLEVHMLGEDGNLAGLVQPSDGVDPEGPPQ